MYHFFPGDDRDSTGSLLSIDSQEGVVKLDQNGDVKMLQLKYLCKLGASIDISGQSNWYSPNIEESALQGQSGVICGVTPGIHSVFIRLNPAKNKHT